MPKKKATAQTKKIILRGKGLQANAGIGAWYRKQLTALVLRMAAACEKRILAFIRASRAAAMDDSDAEQLRKLVEQLEREYAALFKRKAEETAESMLNRQNRYAQSSVKDSLFALGGAAAGNINIDIPYITPQIREIAKTAIFENVSLIRSIQSEYFTDIAGAVSRAVLDDEGIGVLTEHLRKYKATTKRRAQNIARDQNHKIYERIAYEKMKEAGIEHWEWVHGGGTKTVRPTHIRDVKDGGLNHAIFKVGEKAYDPHARRLKGGKYKGEYIEPAQLPYCTCFRRPVIQLGGK